ncbi:MAG TPA: transglutaminase-like domain-containing protein [Chthonomonadaceae bacterium]|nr:transglutaminase-like domain-containing protein [Chthonomonadaceae bacterium]
MPLSRRSAGATRRALLSGLVLSLLLALPAVLLAQAGAPSSAPSATSGIDKPREEWMGWYWDQQKIGYGSARIAPATFQGKPALEETTRSVIKLTVLGASVEINETTNTISDLRYRPLKQTFDVSSKGSVSHVEATYDYAVRKITCRVGSGPRAATQILAIPPGANLAGDDSTFLTQGQQLTPGKKLTVYCLEPITVTLEKIDVEIAGQEAVKDEVSGKQTQAYVVKSTLPMGQGQMTTWETADGDVLRGEMDMGIIRLTLVKQPKEAALGPAPDPNAGPKSGGTAAYTPPRDFAVATAVVTDKPIRNPRRLRSLQVTIAGVPDKHLLLSDARQQEAILPSTDPAAGYSVEVSIHAAPFAAAQSTRLPFHAAALAPYLRPAPYIDSEDPGVRATATRLRGGDTNLYTIACHIRNWVHAHMTPDASIGVPRSASDIYQNRRGVCRDYATLYTAIARAAGVPTRLCSGIVYAEGKFFYHAWAESWVGQWVAFDPTLYDPEAPVPYVDATHIKFAQGDVTGMFDVVAVIGRIHIKVQQAAI